jgi:2-polyprenyl-3-methyl-5-hydroxy-6-metoxy-1,4-benzoquinol methylase
VKPYQVPQSHTTERSEWDQTWANYGDPAEGNPANVYRTHLILKHLGHPRLGDTILDVGCGQGELAVNLQQTFVDARVRGIEYSREGVRRAIAAAKAAAIPAEFIVRDLTEPAVLDAAIQGKATYAVCSEVLEHLDEPETLLRNASAYMARGCRLVVTVPAGPRSAYDRHIGHRRHFTPQLLRSVLENSGFEVDQVVRAGFPFFNLYRLIVIARGRRLIADLESQAHHSERRAANMVLSFFQSAFRWNLDDTPFGWQLIAVGRSAGSDSKL